jgi:integrase
LTYYCGSLKDRGTVTDNHGWRRLRNGPAVIASDNSLLSYVDRVLLARDITPDYAAKVRNCCRKFCEWLECDPGIDGLEPQSVNEFLVYLQSMGKRPDTVAGYRRAIMVVWNVAYLEGDAHIPPLRVRRIRTPREPVDAFTMAEIRILLETARGLTGYFPNGVRRADFWTAVIHLAYSTGLRRGDLLQLERAQILENGVARVLQHKTGYQITVRISSDGLAAVNRMAGARALPWPYHSNALSRQFRSLVKAAGIRPGQFRWLRRSSASYAEQDCPGNGSRILGHRSSRIFGDFYEDQTITHLAPIVPPPLS